MISRLFFASVFALLAASTSYAQDASKAAREKTDAATRYFNSVPFAELQKGIMEEMSKQVPPEQKVEFLNFMTKEMDWQKIETTAKASLTKHLTTNELNALADFMEKPEGKSAMVKMKYYMADLMPVIQKEIQRAVSKIKVGDKKPN